MPTPVLELELPPEKILKVRRRLKKSNQRFDRLFSPMEKTMEWLIESGPLPTVGSMVVVEAILIPIMAFGPEPLSTVAATLVFLPVYALLLFPVMLLAGFALEMGEDHNKKKLQAPKNYEKAESLADQGELLGTRLVDAYFHNYQAFNYLGGQILSLWKRSEHLPDPARSDVRASLTTLSANLPKSTEVIEEVAVKLRETRETVEILIIQQKGEELQAEREMAQESVRAIEELFTSLDNNLKEQL